MPVSISLGLWSTLIMYPLRFRWDRQGHAPRQQVRRLTSSAIIVGYAIPAFLFAILLIVLFAGGSYRTGSLRGLTSANFDDLTLGGKIIDYFWHLPCPSPPW